MELKMSLDQEIKEALFERDPSKNQYIEYSVVPDKKKPEYFELSFGECGSSSPPKLGFSNLLALSRIFGTEQIDVDKYCWDSGCDSCGAGSDYGHTIQIYNATRNVGEFYALVSKGAS